MKCTTLLHLKPLKCHNFILFAFLKNLCLDVHSFHLSLTHTNRQKLKYTSLWKLEISHGAAGGRVSGRVYERLLSGRLNEWLLPRRLNEWLLSGRLVRRLNEWRWSGRMAVFRPRLRVEGHRLRLIGHIGCVPGVHVPWVWTLVQGSAAAGEYATAGEQEGWRHPTDVQRLPEFPALGVDEQRVVEILNDGVCGPGDGNEAAEAAH